jgi:membrane protein YdbS with pleckstrin-like domain
MEAVTFKPDKQLNSFWLTIWAFAMAACIVISLVPLFVVLGVETDFPGAVFSMISVIVFLVVGLPIAMWIPAFYRSLEYTIGGDSVKAKTGVFWKRHVTIPFSKVTNVDVTQGPLQRRFGLGTIHVQTAGAGGQQGGVAELRIYGVGDVDRIKETILSRVSGHAGRGASRRVGEPSTRSDSELLGDILSELITIRRRLEGMGS